MYSTSLIQKISSVVIITKKTLQYFKSSNRTGISLKTMKLNTVLKLP